MMTVIFVRPLVQAGRHHHDQQVQLKQNPSPNRKKEASQPGPSISRKKSSVKIPRQRKSKDTTQVMRRKENILNVIPWQKDSTYTMLNIEDTGKYKVTRL